VSSPNEPSDTGAGTGSDAAQQLSGGAGHAHGARLTDAGVAARGNPTAPPAKRAMDSPAPASAATDSAAPPWQRPRAHAKQPDPRPPAELTRSETAVRAEQRPSAANPPADQRPTVVTPAVPAGSPSSRYVTGTAAPAGLQPARASGADQELAAARTAITRTSELPDLSGPTARSPQRGESASGPTSAGRAAGRIQVGPRSKSGPVRATMQIRRIDPWSALKVSLLLSVALFFVWMIAVAILYLVLGGMGVWSKLNSNVGDLLTTASGGGGELVSSGSIFSGALMIGLVNIVLFTAMATLGAFVYNLTTDIVGGFEVTLADRD
jgi:hypothetical protein